MFDVPEQSHVQRLTNPGHSHCTQRQETVTLQCFKAQSIVILQFCIRSWQLSCTAFNRSNHMQHSASRSKYKNASLCFAASHTNSCLSTQPCYEYIACYVSEQDQNTQCLYQEIIVLHTDSNASEQQTASRASKLSRVKKFTAQFVSKPTMSSRA
jgi:hypothetical protein